MKKLIAIFAAFSLFLPLSTQAVEVASVKGKILLQVESHGEAWYVNPQDSLRYYMKDGEVAYTLMRLKSLGITNVDIAKIPDVESVFEVDKQISVCNKNTLANRLKGYILLQVEEHGEAWYVDPDTCYRVYMKDGDTAYTIMRYLSLGITNTDLSTLPYHPDYTPLAFADVAPQVAGETSTTETIVIREIIREPAVVYVEPSIEESTTSNVTQPTFTAEDIKIEVISIVNQIKTSSAFNAYSSWYNLYGKDFDDLVAEWKLFSSCGSASVSGSANAECQKKIDQYQIETFPFFSTDCYDYDDAWYGACTAQLDKATNWDILVMKPLADKYFSMVETRKNYLDLLGYDDAVSAMSTWNQNLKNPSSIQEWHFDYAVFDEIETNLKEILF